MKKTIIVLITLFTINLACKKEDIGGGALCACSVISNPTLNLVVKNNGGDDLLSSTTSGYIPLSQIQLYYIGSNGNQVPVKFVIRPKFSYGNNQFLYQYIYSDEAGSLAKSIDQSFYLKLADKAPIELNIQVNNSLRRVDKLLINKVNTPPDPALLNYVDIYYLTL